MTVVYAGSTARRSPQRRSVCAGSSAAERRADIPWVGGSSPSPRTMSFGGSSARVERRPYKALVAGSKPARRTTMRP